MPNFRDLDWDNDGTFDVRSSRYTALDANGDGRIDTGADSDEDGIRDSADPAPLVFGTFEDRDGDGVSDALDLDIDNDGIPNSADGSDDSDGDGLPNLADADSDGDGLTDSVEAGGTDSNGDGVADNFVDTNGNGLSDQFESTLGGRTLPLPDSDGDGAGNHRDVDSDGDGTADVIEGGGRDMNGDGRQDGPDADQDGLADSADSTATGGRALPRPDSDGDGTPDGLDEDSDNDGVGDRLEGRGDSDGDGIPDSLDAPGGLQTAVRGTGGFDPLTLLGLAGAFVLLVLRRRALHVVPITVIALGGMQPGTASAAEAKRRAAPEATQTGFYVGVDAGISRLEPRNPGGGYVVNDESSPGYRALIGYAWSAQWSAEAFYADGGKAGISSDTPAVGHLGDIAYKLSGVGVEWAPVDAGRNARFFPLLKAGAVRIDNSASASQIVYDKVNDVGVYIGGGAGLRLGASWRAQAEIVSYDQDELFMSLGIRKHW